MDFFHTIDFNIFVLKAVELFVNKNVSNVNLEIAANKERGESSSVLEVEEAEDGDDEGESEGDRLEDGGGVDSLLPLPPLLWMVRESSGDQHHHTRLQAEVVEAGEEEVGGSEGQALQTDPHHQGYTHRHRRHEEDNKLGPLQGELGGGHGQMRD